MAIDCTAFWTNSPEHLTCEHLLDLWKEMLVWLNARVRVAGSREKHGRSGEPALDA